MIAFHGYISDRTILQAPGLPCTPHFKGLGMRNLQYEIKNWPKRNMDDVKLL